ncbi:hypothetical protein MSAN_01888400 [Mycena sanguinolenta]|uniref:Aquaporin n=1 Tax=Mycena sanguinolenta TaxID=230812 RepID=A0A8H7CSH0_9AGAR|nr:hypothetical protein MSAN_01888400 [Mycena sanguinolenta]
MSMSKAPDGMSTNDSSSKEEHHYVEHIENYEGHDSPTVHPNAWFKYRLALREYVAEFMGEYRVAVLIIFGTGVDCQVVLSSVTGVAPSAKGFRMGGRHGNGVWVSGGISGGHINPAVTLALATFRGFPWRKVPGYILAQVLGGLCGAGIIYANYFHAITIFEGGRDVRTLATASLFSTYAPSLDEFLGTAVLMVMVLAINDKKTFLSRRPRPPS